MKINKNVLWTSLLILLSFPIVDTASAAASTNYTATSAPSNVIVNFDSTSLDSSLRRRDSGTLNLVIQNSGSKRAENVEVWLPGSTSIRVGKRFDIGTVEASGSKTIPVLLRVDDNAKTGMHTIQVSISFDGYDAEGDRKNNMLTTWEIPVRVYGDPLFQLSPSKTTYYKDNLDDLDLQGYVLDSVRDLEATLSSSCVTVIGSSRKFVGDVNSNQSFNLTYPIKPSSSGACTASLLLEYTDESGSSAYDNISIGLNIEDAGVDFKVVNISYAPTGPGETVTVTVGLKNVGQANAGDTTLSLSLSDPFFPVDTSEKYVGTVAGGETVDVKFGIAIGWDAEIKPYSVPLNITYKVGGSSYSVKKEIGIDVSGKVVLEVINVQQSGRSLQIEVANIGTRTAEGVKGILTTAGTGNRTGVRQQQTQETTQSAGTPRQTAPANPLAMLTGGRSTGNWQRTQETQSSQTISQTGGSQQLVEYKSDIKPTKQTTFNFETTASGPVTLTLEYTGLNNERITHTEVLSVGGTASALTLTGTRQVRGTSTTRKILYALVVLLLIWAAYRRHKHEKIVPQSVRKRIPEPLMHKVDKLSEKLMRKLGKLREKISRKKR